MDAIPVPLVNATAPAMNATISTDEPLAFPTNISSFIAFLYSFSALRDWVKLIVVGGLFEVAKFSIPPGNTRDMQITTDVPRGNSPAVVLEGEDENVNEFYKSSRKIAYLPSVFLTYSLWYKRRWMTITRTQQQAGIYGDKENVLHISILTELLQEARRFYMAGQEHNMCIYVADSSANHWNHVACRAKRSMHSIVLEPGIKDILLEDARDFLRGKSWYAERGIPFRRGYLLHGAPGSGKTSMIHCMAGELGLDVYIISLSRAGIDDATLSELVNGLPERCIALMEDIDAAFTHGVSRGGMSDSSEDSGKTPSKSGEVASTAGKLSLSGLLNALDGVGAQEGRILFATTNKYSALDPALCRPGRMDLHIEFKNSSKFQARELFERFYLPTPVSEREEQEKKEPCAKEEERKGSGNEDDSVESHNVTKTVFEQNAERGLFTGVAHTGRAPILGPARIAELADRFADAIPERECSMASLQGFLMSYKTRPVEAAHEAAAWVAKERVARETEREKEKERGKGNKKGEEKYDIVEENTKDQKAAVPHSSTPCNCEKVPRCRSCGGALAEKINLPLPPSPVSKPASPPGLPQELPLLNVTNVADAFASP
ncbi:hypothetical protein H0H81_007878 [Sphagnurus paluster]|uniref:Mitochondrial chaperone BCS1 n=1 Tax=Sphagnurus paluster TaxID=117069 RepID=A0A9P7FQ69_9AGAR|nr:hypothetical protein H0H81_007878 [Sphagnurus paluster]